MQNNISAVIHFTNKCCFNVQKHKKLVYRALCCAESWKQWKSFHKYVSISQRFREIHKKTCCIISV